MKNIVVCCDGTWCGEAAGTSSNIKILADSFACQPVPENGPAENKQTGTIVRYYSGVGMPAATVVDYTLDAMLATSIRDRCVEAYKFIVDNFQLGAKVWLFGLSRGAYTVRSVAGMVNNLGILRKDLFKPEDVQSACEQVYHVFRDRDEQYRPDGEWSRKFHAEKSWQTVTPPIVFMGLLDTVGALGVPKLDPGMAVSYEMYDQVVSSEVEHVYQALAVHDRFANFTPCFVRRNQKSTRYHGAHAPKTEVERWFPGAHYDVGRQRLVYGRYNHGTETLLRRVLDLTNFLHTNLTYSNDLANPPLQFLIEGVQHVDPDILPDSVETYLPTAPEPLPLTWHLPTVQPWASNAYDHIMRTWTSRLLAQLPCWSTLQQILSTQVVCDRHIPLYWYKPEHFWGYDPKTPQDNTWRRKFRATPMEAGGQLPETGQVSRAFDAWELLTSH